MKTMYKSLLSVAVIVSLSGCDNPFKNEKYELVETKTFPYLINKENGDLYMVKDTHKVKVNDGIEKKVILSDKLNTTNTNIKIKCKIYEDAIFYQVIVSYKPDLVNYDITFDSWKNYLKLKNNYFRVSPYFTDNDNMQLLEKEILLSENISFVTSDSIVYNGVINAGNLFNKILQQSYVHDIKYMNLSYMLPDFKEFAKKKQTVKSEKVEK